MIEPRTPHTSDADTPGRRRPVGIIILTVLFAFAFLSALNETIAHVLSPDGEPPALGALQGLTAASALSAAIGIWRQRSWSVGAVFAYGIIAAGMVVLIGPMLDLDANARSGLWGGAAMILLFVGLCAWYLRRVTRRGNMPEPEADVRPV